MPARGMEIQLFREFTLCAWNLRTHTRTRHVGFAQCSAHRFIWEVAHSPTAADPSPALFCRLVGSATHTSMPTRAILYNQSLPIVSRPSPHFFRPHLPFFVPSSFPRCFFCHRSLCTLLSPFQFPSHHLPCRQAERLIGVEMVTPGREAAGWKIFLNSLARHDGRQQIGLQ